MTGRMLILGHGYTASFLTPMLLAQGWQVIGTTRHGFGRVAAAGAEPLQWPGQEGAVRDAIAQADAILVSAAPDGDGDPAFNAFAHDITASPARWVGYLSTTGVYGDREGGWVDEGAELTPLTLRGKQRVQAEAQWQSLPVPLHIFRLAGIYGPGRGPFAKVRAGTARRIIKPGQVFSRIHVQDIAQVLLASINAPRPGRVYNVCDDDPAPPEDVIAHAAELIGQPIPVAEDYATAQMTPMARSFYAESKRVSNDRIRQELGVTLRYPDYRAGLKAMLEDEGMADDA